MIYCKPFNPKMQTGVRNISIKGPMLRIIARNMTEIAAPTLRTHNSPSAASPLLSHFQSRWPKPRDEPLPVVVQPVPRTIPDSLLRFQFKATFTHGSAIFYPHLKHHPADYKVGLVVKIADMGFNSDLERQIFIEMVGPRYNGGRQDVRFTCEKFANRLENKKYVTYLLEKLVAEAKHLATVAHDYDEKE